MKLSLKFSQLILALICYCVNTSAFANASIFKLSDNKDYQLIESAEFFEDESAQMSLEQVIDKNQFVSFENGGKFSFGYTESAVWMRVTVQNLSPNSTWNLGSERPEISRFDIYEFQDGRLLNTYKNGSSLSHEAC